jgi:hypothetical protein
VVGSACGVTDDVCDCCIAVGEVFSVILDRFWVIFEEQAKQLGRYQPPDLALLWGWLWPQLMLQRWNVYGGVEFGCFFLFYSVKSLAFTVSLARTGGNLHIHVSNAMERLL